MKLLLLCIILVSFCAANVPDTVNTDYTVKLSPATRTLTDSEIVSMIHGAESVNEIALFTIESKARLEIERTRNDIAKYICLPIALNLLFTIMLFLK